jgi:FkbM family methyltransferase
MEGEMQGKSNRDPCLRILDVGAWGGAARDWFKIGNFVEIFGFEPDTKECERLNTLTSADVRLQRFYPYAISGKTGPRKFYITRRPTCSSLLKPIEAEWKRYATPGSDRHRRAEVIQTVSLNTITLDDFCECENISPTFVKLDTQGSELEILKYGFVGYLPRVLGLEVEVEFVQLYEKQPLFSELEMFLRENGFDLFGLKRHRWKVNDQVQCTKEAGGRLVFGDALFFNKALFNRKLDKESAVSGILLLKRYGLNDVADFVAAAYNISGTDIAGYMLRGRRSQREPLKSLVKKYLHRHPDRGNIIEYDDAYAF